MNQLRLFGDTEASGLFEYLPEDKIGDVNENNINFELGCKIFGCTREDLLKLLKYWSWCMQHDFDKGRVMHETIDGILREHGYTFGRDLVIWGCG